jgi:hypothetical protein
VLVEELNEQRLHSRRNRVDRSFDWRPKWWERMLAYRVHVYDHRSMLVAL